MSPAESTLRRELAAAFRWTARFGWHESVANHFSAVIPGEEHMFLLNPIGRHFSRMSASELVTLDSRLAGGSEVDSRADATAWFLHSRLHRSVPRAKVVLHTHMPYATTLACLADYEFQMLDQNACRFHDRIAYDRNYSGMFLGDGEGGRVADMLADGRDILLLGGHGVLVIGNSVAEAFEDLYYLERASMLQVQALQTGRPLAVIPDHIAALTRQQWFAYPADCDLHFRELLAILDDEGDSYSR